MFGGFGGGGAGGAGDCDPFRNQSPIDFGPKGLVYFPNVNKPFTEFHQFSVNHFADEPHMRNFVVSSADVFTIAKKAFKEHYPEPVPQPIIASLSQMYRGLIVDLSRSCNKSNDVASYNLYTKLELVWSFAEVMFITSHPELPILPYLCDWILSNFEPPSIPVDLLIREREMNNIDQEEIENVWNVIFCNTIQGRTREAEKYLTFLNPSRKGILEGQIVMMSELMRKKPKYRPTVSSISDFETKMNHWQAECKNRLDNKAFWGSDKLIFLCKIMAGDDNGFQEAKEKMNTWFEYLIMILNYKFPTLKPMGLKNFARESHDLFNEFSHKVTPFENVLMSALEFDIASVLREMQIHWNNPWFVLHFAHLIYIGGKFSRLDDPRLNYNSVSPLLYQFLYEYGSQLMQHPTLYQVGVAYLDTIRNRDGLFVIRELLMRIKPKSEKDTLKIMRTAQELGLKEEVKGISRMMALEKLKNKQYQNALLWSIKANDRQLTTYISDKILFEGNCEIETSLLESLKSSISCAERLLFLGNYCEFRKFMDKKEFTKAVNHLCQLINDKLIPKRFATQVMKSVHTLSENNVKLETWQTTILVKYLHTELGIENVEKEDTSKIASFLMCNRSNEILQHFKRV